MQYHDPDDILTVSLAVLSLSRVFHRTFRWTGKTRAFLGCNLPWRKFFPESPLAAPNSSSSANLTLGENAAARQAFRSRAQQPVLQQGQEQLDDLPQYSSAMSPLRQACYHKEE